MESKLRIFFTSDNDRGNPNWIVAKTIRTALDLHKATYGYDPQYIKEMQGDYDTVLIADFCDQQTKEG